MKARSRSAWRGSLSGRSRSRSFVGSALKDTPDDLIHDLFAAQVWAGHPLGRPILGTREAVTGFGRDLIVSHFGEHYVPHEHLLLFMEGAAEGLRGQQVEVIYGTIRMIRQDTTSFLP